MDIDEVRHVNDQDYSITISMYFNVEWNEPRLNMVTSNSTETVMVPTSVELVKDLWLPNIFIYNLKTFKVLSALALSLLFKLLSQITSICALWGFQKLPVKIILLTQKYYSFSE